MKKKISILGSTGSIGVNALKILSNLKDQFELICLTANTNSSLLLQQIEKFKPKSICIVDLDSYEQIKNELDSFDVEVLTGRSGLLEISKRDNVDIILNALVGASGMEPTINALNAGVDVALANKETLVMAGNIIDSILMKKRSKIFPVDSEHSAIWHCLLGEDFNDIERLILTGSGGPFRTRDLATFDSISIEEALNHPNWDMGNKITIDSATMMNKGLEVIEAHWLFNFNADDIDIVVHPQSIIHSMVEMKDKSIKAQMGLPDMKIPIQYALTYPRHIKTSWEGLDFFKIGNLTFEQVDLAKFPSISLAYRALDRLGTACAALNLSNDFSVNLFLNGRIKFTEISRINEEILDNHPWTSNPNLSDLLNLENWVKEYLSKY
tara:strand:- start:305 stop:1450 length:1146 start_codon:yes stop_codon:yes gene_type:complete